MNSFFLSFLSTVLMAMTQVSLANVDDTAGAILNDDECHTDGSHASGGTSCALSALQRRSSTSAGSAEEPPSTEPEESSGDMNTQAEAIAEESAEQGAPPPSSEIHTDIDTSAEAIAAATAEDGTPPPISEIDTRRVTTWHELKDAVESSEVGRQIIVPEGAELIFEGCININKGAHFDIRSEGRGATLNGQNGWGRVRLFYVRGSLSLDGFLIENGQKDYAGAAYFDFGSMGRISHCTFRNNDAKYMGGAIVTAGAKLLVNQVDFHGNTAQNQCLDPKHCSRRRRNGRRANAVYVMSKAKVDATLKPLSRSQDFFFDRNFRGQAMFHCNMPRMEATDHRVAKHHVHKSRHCNMTSDNQGK